MRPLATTLARLLVVLSVGACAPRIVRPDQTGGTTLEFRWTSADGGRASLYLLGTDGVFASAGGLAAREGVTQGTRQFELALKPDEIERLLTLLRATAYATRPSESGGSGDRSEITVRDPDGRSRFAVRGTDPSVDALAAYCRELSLRQFRDVIEAQPVAGERRSSR
jgi:hypothetical protein